MILLFKMSMAKSIPKQFFGSIVLGSSSHLDRYKLSSVINLTHSATVIDAPGQPVPVVHDGNPSRASVKVVYTDLGALRHDNAKSHGSIHSQHRTVKPLEEQKMPPCKHSRIQLGNGHQPVGLCATWKTAQSL